MFFWFIGLSFLLVWFVFQSPALDYRFVMLGAVFPVLEISIGRPAFFHTLFSAVFFLTLVMVATQKRRLLRRRLIGFPIGLFIHLILDATWSKTNLFWWSLTGFGFQKEKLLEFSNSNFSLILFSELLGIGALFWCFKIFGLVDKERRKLFIHSGQLDRKILE